MLLFVMDGKLYIFPVFFYNLANLDTIEPEQDKKALS